MHQPGWAGCVSGWQDFDDVNVIYMYTTSPMAYARVHPVHQSLCLRPWPARVNQLTYIIWGYIRQSLGPLSHSGQKSFLNSIPFLVHWTQLTVWPLMGITSTFRAATSLFDLPFLWSSASGSSISFMKRIWFVLHPFHMFKCCFPLIFQSPNFLSSIFRFLLALQLTILYSSFVDTLKWSPHVLSCCDPNTT